MTTVTTSQGSNELFPRISTGNAQADVVLGGGLPAHSINIVMGLPGTGKTVFAEQLLFRNAGEGRPSVYVSTLSEPMTKMVSYVQRFSYFDANKLGTEILYEDIGPLLSSDGPSALVPWIAQLIKTASPKLIVIDSFRAIHDLSTSVSETRRLVSDLAGLLSAYDSTVFLLGEYTTEDVQRYPEFAVSDAIVQLARQPLGSRDERYLRVLKLRGSSYREGQHAFRITDDGIQLYPRLVSPRIATTYTPQLTRTSIGVPGLDEMLEGGLWGGSTTLLVGPTGSGKTTVAMHFALEGVARKEPTLYVNFQENPAQLARSFANLGADTNATRDGGLEFMYVSPVELQIDSIVVGIFERIKDGTIRRVVVDAVGDLITAASDTQRLHDYLYSLVQHFAVNGVTSLLTFESGISAYGGLDTHEQRFSYMSDNVLAIALGGEERTRRTIRVIKTRNSGHDPVVRSLDISGAGARVS
ncbi:MAG TPA: ATPase domain-containing protein [Gemmatimonadaceae bacterium]|nr:ATPase domain-containing protein [Gemmatimonadaceae bacterium]